MTQLLSQVFLILQPGSNRNPIDICSVYFCNWCRKLNYYDRMLFSILRFLIEIPALLSGCGERNYYRKD